MPQTHQPTVHFYPLPDNETYVLVTDHPAIGLHVIGVTVLSDDVLYHDMSHHLPQPTIDLMLKGLPLPASETDRLIRLMETF